MFPELVTRPDIKVFLPPINGLTIYMVRRAPPAVLSQPPSLLCQTWAHHLHGEKDPPGGIISATCSCPPTRTTIYMVSRAPLAVYRQFI